MHGDAQGPVQGVMKSASSRSCTCLLISTLAVGDGRYGRWRIGLAEPVSISYFCNVVPGKSDNVSAKTSEFLSRRLCKVRVSFGERLVLFKEIPSSSNDLWVP